MANKMRKGPFKGKRWEEIELSELLNFLQTEEAQWDINIDLYLRVLDEIDRRRASTRGV